MHLSPTVLYVDFGCHAVQPALQLLSKVVMKFKGSFLYQEIPRI